MHLDLNLDTKTIKEDERVRGICSCGKFRKLSSNAGEIVLCGSAKGIDAPSTPDFRDVWKGEVCIATMFYQEGNNYRPSVNVEKMKGCNYIPHA
jgi:hypothetical protein